MRNAFIVAGLVAVLLTGCVEPAPVISPTAAPGEPVFASEEEALAAAEEVFAKYLEASTQMAASGGVDMTPFDGLLTERQLADETETAASLVERGWHLEGDLDYYGFAPQQIDLANPRSAYIQAYVCLDLQGVAYFNEAGEDQSAVDHAPSSPLEVVFVSAPNDSTTLLIDLADTWTGSNFCQ